MPELSGGLGEANGEAWGSTISAARGLDSRLELNHVPPILERVRTVEQEGRSSREQYGQR